MGSGLTWSSCSCLHWYLLPEYKWDGSQMVLLVDSIFYIWNNFCCLFIVFWGGGCSCFTQVNVVSACDDCSWSDQYSYCSNTFFSSLFELFGVNTGSLRNTVTTLAQDLELPLELVLLVRVQWWASLSFSSLPCCAWLCFFPSQASVYKAAVRCFLGSD